MQEAKELLIQQRAVHLDSLAERLRDSRVKRIVQTILTGEADPTLTDGDDFRLSMDLGLVVKNKSGPAIANPIYREDIARVLSQGMQDAIPEPESVWKRLDGPRTWRPSSMNSRTSGPNIRRSGKKRQTIPKHFRTSCS